MCVCVCVCVCVCGWVGELSGEVDHLFLLSLLNFLCFGTFSVLSRRAESNLYTHHRVVAHSPELHSAQEGE